MVSEANLTTEGEVHAGCSKYNAFFGIDGDFPVCPEVIEATLECKETKKHLLLFCSTGL
jgi:hypothetical protein